jgi:hypothetical protein
VILAGGKGELSSWAIMLIGLAGLGFVSLRNGTSKLASNV